MTHTTARQIIPCRKMLAKQSVTNGCTPTFWVSTMAYTTGNMSAKIVGHDLKRGQCKRRILVYTISHSGTGRDLRRGLDDPRLRATSEQLALNGIMPATSGQDRALGQRIHFVVREVPESSRHLQEMQAALSETGLVLGGLCDPFRVSTPNVI
jgi:hypothetical protein